MVLMKRPLPESRQGEIFNGQRPCHLIGNPYHWTQLELKRYFDDLLLGPDTAEEIGEHCNLRLSQPDFSATVSKRSTVEVIYTMTR